MKKGMILPMIILFLWIKLPGLAQNNSINSDPGIRKLENVFDIKKEHNHYKHYIQKADNEIIMVTAAFFLAYKEVISSQDINACSFYPTCSEYTVQTIQKNNFFYGVFDAVDRLTRCHPLAGSGHHYPIHESTHKLYDPVK